MFVSILMPLLSLSLRASSRSYRLEEQSVM
nr:MAG TPA: hypothetical protein [Caudoviricetes sp.]